MLTPQEISSKEFVKAVFGGYDMSSVDDFLETLTADYTALYKENAILKSKIKVLVEKVEEYRSTDEAMRMALLTAQKLSEEITAEAKKKREEMLAQTENEIRERLQEMKARFAEEEARLRAVKEETRKFILASQEIMRQHSLFLSRLEELSREQGPSSRAAEDVREAAADESERDASGGAEAAGGRPEAADDAADDAAGPEGGTFETFLDNDDDVTKVFRARAGGDDSDDEPTSPRPKFNFSNLKFGPNYTGD